MPKVSGCAFVTASGCVLQLGHLPRVLCFSALKVCASLSTGTFTPAAPFVHLMTPAGAPDGSGPAKTMLPLPKASWTSVDGKPRPPTKVRSSAEGMTRPVFHTLAKGDRGHSLASCLARAWNAAMFTRKSRSAACKSTWSQNVAQLARRRRFRPAINGEDEKRPSARKSLPAWAFTLGADDGNRTRTVSLGS
jgi:hypothetical protein